MTLRMVVLREWEYRIKEGTGDFSDWATLTLKALTDDEIAGAS